MQLIDAGRAWLLPSALARSSTRPISINQWSEYYYVEQLCVNLDVLNGPECVAYLSGVDGRIRAGFRAALETLGLPLPDHIARRATGRKPGQHIAAAFAADSAIHGDRTFTPSGNRRLEYRSAPNRAPATVSPILTPNTGIARPESEQAACTLFTDVFGSVADQL